MNHPKGLTIEEVSRKLSLNRATAAKYLNSMRLSGQAEMRTLGPAKLFYLSHRLPLADLMSLSSDLILILDDELFIQHVNEPFLRLFDVELVDLKGQRFDQSVLATSLEGAPPEQLKEALEGHDIVFDCIVKRAGRTRSFRARALPLVFEAGARGVALILEDVTELRRHQQDLEVRVRARTYELERANEALEREIDEHRRTETALAASRRTFEQVVETTPNLIYVYNTDEVRLCYANRNLETILGYATEGIRTGERTEILPLVHPDDRPVLEVHRSLLGSAPDGEVHELEVRVRHALGHYVGLLCRELVFQRDVEGHPTRMIGTAEDITERRRAEDALKAANRQIQLLNRITRHDILNQLNILAVSLQERSQVESELEAKQRIEREKAAIESIRRQITFTRHYQGIGTRPPGWFPVQDVVDRAVSGLDRRGIGVERGDCDFEVFADPLIERVFSILVDNTLQHGGAVTRLRFSCWPYRGGMVISCEDDGVGLPESDKERVFDRGFGKNGGCNLFLAREILAITGLAIRETGRPGAGARFEILVPHGLSRPGAACD